MTVYISFFLDYPIKESCPIPKEGERHKWGVSDGTQVRKTAAKSRRGKEHFHRILHRGNEQTQVLVWSDTVELEP